jgi:hypothetical protein
VQPVIANTIMARVAHRTTPTTVIQYLKIIGYNDLPPDFQAIYRTHRDYSVT